MGMIRTVAVSSWSLRGFDCNTDLVLKVSGRDLMAATAGLYEVTKEVYLRHRINQVQHFALRLQAAGIAVLSPP
jgi:tryptophanase